MNRITSPFSCSNRLINELTGVFYSLAAAPSYSILFVSRQCFRFTGYDPEELLEQDCTFYRNFIHRDDLDHVRKVRKQSLGVSGISMLDYRMISKKGNILYVRDQWVSHKKDDGQWIIKGYITESTDVRGRLMHQLKAYRDAVDVNMISSITDKTGKIIYANENFCRISKYSVQELVGQNHRIVCSGHHPKEFFIHLWKTISAGKLWNGEILNKAKDGTLYWVDTVIIPIFDEDKRIDKYLSLRMLITDRKRSEQQRKKYTDMLERIAFIVAHDVRGPLCTILGLVHILSTYKHTNEEVRVVLGYMNDSALRLNEITRTLSQFVYENEIELKIKALEDQIVTDVKQAMSDEKPEDI